MHEPPSREQLRARKTFFFPAQSGRYPYEYQRSMTSDHRLTAEMGGDIVVGVYEWSKRKEMGERKCKLERTYSNYSEGRTELSFATSNFIISKSDSGLRSFLITAT